MTIPGDFRVIDTHVHVWEVSAPWMRWLDGRPDNWDVIRRDFGWPELQSELDQAGVSEIVLVQATTDRRETKLLLELADDQPRISGVVGWASLLDAAATDADLAYLHGPGSGKLVGIRHHQGWSPEGDVLSTTAPLASLRLLAERGLSLDILPSGQDSLNDLLPWCQRVRDGRFVIDHLGRPILDEPDAFTPWADAMAALSRCPNVVVKYSGWATFMSSPRSADVQRHIDFVLDCFGPERIMFASNWPVALVAGSYSETYRESLDAIEGLRQRDLETVLHGTAERIYLQPMRERQQLARHSRDS